MKEKFSMKNIIIFLLLFAIVSIGITMVLVLNTNSKNENESQTSGEKVSEKNNDETKVIDESELAISDFYEHFYTNNIEIEEVKYGGGGIWNEYDSYNKQYIERYYEDVQYLKIDGLKDEAVEEKINNRIKEKVFSIMENEMKGDIEGIKITTYDGVNFSNIFSIRISVMKYNDNYISNFKNGTYDYEFGKDYFYEYRGSTFNLITGEEIKIEDCFIAGTDIKSIYIGALYENMFVTNYGAGDVNYSENVIDTWYWEDDDTNVKKALMDMEEELFLTMYEFEKGNYDLYIDENGKIFIYVNGYQTSSNFYKNYSKIAIFKRYLTDENIYTDEYENSKKIWCSSSSWYFDYVTDNLIVIARDMDRIQNLENIDRTYGEWEYYTNKLYQKRLDAEIEYTKNRDDIVNVLFLSDGLLKMEIPKDEFDIEELAEVMTKELYDYESEEMYGGGYLSSYVIKDEYLKLKKPNTFVAFEYDNDFSMLYDIYEECVEYNKYGYINGEWNHYETQLSKNILTPYYLEYEDDATLEVLYNYFFAIHGHDFKNESLRKIFMGEKWYCPIYNKSVSIEELNEIERQNLEMIKNEINSRKNGQ